MNSPRADFKARLRAAATPGVGLGQDADAGIRGGDALDDFDGAVRRAVVDDDDFEVLVGLLQDRVEGTLNEGLRVEGRDDDGY